MNLKKSDEVRSQKKWEKEVGKEPRSKLTPRKQTKSVALWSDSCVKPLRLPRAPS